MALKFGSAAAGLLMRQVTELATTDDAVASSAIESECFPLRVSGRRSPGALGCRLAALHQRTARLRALRKWCWTRLTNRRHR